MRAAGLAGAFAMLISAATPARAQASADGPSLRAGHVTLGGGVTITGGYGIGAATAALRGNAPGASAPPFTLFRAETRVEAAPGGEARVGVAITRGLSVEAGFGYARPRLETRLSQDPEATPATLDAERLDQYVIDVGVTWQLPGGAIAGRLRPFASGGAGYLRQLYRERTVAETGRLYSLGGGVRYWLRGGDGVRRSIGLRGDVRAQWRVDGVEFEGRTRVAPVAVLQLFAEL